MATREEKIKYVIEGEDKASGVFDKVRKNVAGLGQAIVAGAAAGGAALLGLGASMVHLAADAEPLIGVRKAFMNLTEDVKGGGEAMLAALRESSRGWVTNADLMMSFNQASSLVGEDFARKLPEAMQYLTKVAASTGMDMNYMLDSLVRGVGRLSPLILDNLGIQATLGEATERAAEMFGKEADELSKAEQQAGMMNVIMEKLKVNTEKIELPEKSFASFGVTLENMRHELGEKLVPMLSPFIDLLSKVAVAVGDWLARALEKAGPFIEALGKVVGAFFDSLAAGEDPLKAVYALIMDLAKAFGLHGKAFGDLYRIMGDLVGFFKKLRESGDDLFARFEDGSTVLENLFEVFGMAEGPARDLANTIIDIKDAVMNAIQPIIDWVSENVELKDVLIALGIAVATFVLPILLSILGAILPIIATIGALILVVTLIRTAWEENWGGIRDKLTEAWENTIRPALEQLWAWLKEKIPEAIAALKVFWEETLLPALQTVWSWVKEKLIPALVDVYEWLKENIPLAIEKAKEFWEEKLKPALEKVWEFIRDKVIPAIQDVVAWLQENIPIAIERAREFWEEKLKPALETVWEFIQDKVIPIIEDVVAWLKEKIPEAIAKAKEFWEEKLKPALETVWEFIDEHVLPLLEALWELISESLNVAVEVLAGLWENVLKPALEKVWEFIQDKVIPIIEDLWEWLGEKLGPAVDTAKKALEPLKEVLGKIGDALDWVKGLIQSVTEKLKNIKLPDWLVGHSPSPFEKTLFGIHAALGLVNRDLGISRQRFAQLGRVNMSPGYSVGLTGQTTYSAGGAAGSVTNHNYYLTANYAYREEADLIQDVRLLELMNR